MSGATLGGTRAVPPIERAATLLPGLGLLFAVGYAGKLTEQGLTAWGKSHHVVLPNIEYVLWAILYGLIVANLVGVPRIFRAGVATHEFWLKLGIVLLGVRFLLGDVLNATIGFVVLGYALYWAARGDGVRVANKAAFLWAKFPKFVLGFLAVSLLATFGAFSKADAANLAALSRWAFLLTFAGVGLSTDLREIQALGWRPLAVATGGMAGIAVLTFVFVWTADWSGWL